MGQSLFNINDVIAKNPSTVTLGLIIQEVLCANDGACYAEMEKYLMPPGVSGSRFFDQSEAVNVLLRHDAEQDSPRLMAAIKSTQSLTRIVLWDKLQKELRKIGFQMRHGRLVGVIEDKSTKSEQPEEQVEAGQPDIA